MASKEECLETLGSTRVIKVTRQWTIENVTFSCGLPDIQSVPSSKIGSFIKSAPFSPSPNSYQMKFSISLFPYNIGVGKRGGPCFSKLSDKIEIFLDMNSCANGQVPILIKMWLEGQSKKEYIILESKTPSTKIARFSGDISRDDVSKPKPFLSTFVNNDLLWDDDTLKINVEIRFLADNPDFNHLTEMARNLSLECCRSLLKSKEHSDVVICIEEDHRLKEIHAHKAILAKRSSVFAAMFEHEFEETQKNRVHITDMKLDVFEMLIRYIYCGEIVQLEEYAMELLEAADKYDLEQLKQFCQQFLCLKLSNECAIDLLVLADIHNAVELKASSIDYIKRNINVIMKTDKWVMMFKNHPKLFEDFLTQFKD